MIGIIVLILLSALLLWFIQKEQLEVLGFKLTKSRIKQFCLGLLLSATTCIAYHIMATFFADNHWISNTEITLTIIVSSMWFTLKSVLFEEFIFRGVILYLAIQKWGTKRACLLSATCFGCYHWFSYNAFGNLFQMAIIFLMTGFFGWILALAFAKTKSLYLPIALHLGWNLFNIVVFSNGPLGNQLLIKANENKTEGIISLFIFLFQLGALPIFSSLYLKTISTKPQNLI